MNLRNVPRVCALVFMLCLAPATWAQVVSEYEYEANRVYPVRTALGITTQIELNPHENILDYSTGFSSGWELTRRGNVFYLKPRNLDVDTNMMVRTERNAYIFELKVVASDWTTLEQAKLAGVQYRIGFRYPAEVEFQSARQKQDAPQAQLSTALEKDRRYNFNYDFKSRSRSRWMVPATVYDDGRFTYIRLNETRDTASGNFPVVFGRERESSEDFVVNTTTEGSTIVVHGVYPYLAIRHGVNVVGLRRNLSP